MSFYLSTMDDTVKIYQKSSNSSLLTRGACGITLGRRFRGLGDSSNRVLAIATTCVKDSSYPSMHSRAHSTRSVTAARGYCWSGICLLHTPENGNHNFKYTARRSMTHPISIHTSTSPQIDVSFLVNCNAYLQLDQRGTQSGL